MADVFRRRRKLTRTTKTLVEQRRSSVDRAVRNFFGNDVKSTVLDSGKIVYDLNINGMPIKACFNHVRDVREFVAAKGVSIKPEVIEAPDRIPEKEEILDVVAHTGEEGSIDLTEVEEDKPEEVKSEEKKEDVKNGG